MDQLEVSVSPVARTALKVQGLFIACGLAMVGFGYLFSLIVTPDPLRLRAGTIALFLGWVVMGAIYSVRLCWRQRGRGR